MVPLWSRRGTVHDHPRVTPGLGRRHHDIEDFRLDKSLCKSLVDHLRILVPFVGAYPHLESTWLATIHSHERVNAYLSKRAEASENAATNPRGVLALSRRGNADLHVLDGQFLDLAHQPIREVLAQR
jgi:hypothetical protein